MIEDIKKNQKEEVKDSVQEEIESAPEIQNRLIGGLVGKYAISYSNKLYAFEFPYDNTIETNLSVLTFLRDEVVKAIVEKNKREAEKSKENSTTSEVE